MYLSATEPQTLALLRLVIAEAVRFRTVSHQDAADNDVGEWDRLHDWLQSTYPAAQRRTTS